MDGYAARLADLTQGILPVSAEVRIGTEPPALKPSTAVRIVTGGPVPQGADLVIRREDVREQPDAISFDRSIVKDLKAGTSIRRRSENLAAGKIVVQAGVEITPPVAAALACFGAHRPLVTKRVRVGVLVTR